MGSLCMGSLSSMRAAKVADHFGESSPSGVIAGSVQHFSLQPAPRRLVVAILCVAWVVLRRGHAVELLLGREAGAIVGSGGATHHLGEHEKMTAAHYVSRGAGL